jgi:WD40 repeat protein
MSALRLALILMLAFAANGFAAPANDDGARPVELVLQRGSQVEVPAVAFSPDGRIVASAGESEAIHLWDRESGELVRILPGHTERVVGLAFSPNGKYLASSGTLVLGKMSSSTVQGRRHAE